MCWPVGRPKTCFSEGRPKRKRRVSWLILKLIWKSKRAERRFSRGLGHIRAKKCAARLGCWEQFEAATSNPNVPGYIVNKNAKLQQQTQNRSLELLSNQQTRHLASPVWSCLKPVRFQELFTIRYAWALFALIWGVFNPLVLFVPLPFRWVLGRILCLGPVGWSTSASFWSRGRTWRKKRWRQPNPPPPRRDQAEIRTNSG